MVRTSKGREMAVRKSIAGCALFLVACVASCAASEETRRGSFAAEPPPPPADFGGEQRPDAGPRTCSADLQNVVSGDGIAQKCPPDQGCFEGACVPACDAAAASRGSIGCEFHAPDPPFQLNGEGEGLDGPCFAAFVANTWSRPAKISVERGGVALDVTSFARIPRTSGGVTTYEPLPADGIPPDEVAILFLSHKPGVTNLRSLECPVTPAVLEDAAVSGPGRGRAFHLRSDTPISAYDILPYGGASSALPSATLLYPSTAWGTNYVVVAPHTQGPGKPWVDFVGTEDGTTITLAPKVALGGGPGLPDAPGGTVTTLTIGRGEIVQYIGSDPTGAVVKSDKPIGVWTGSTYLEVTTSTMGPGGHDSAHQQLPHVQALGREYVSGSIVTRRGNLQAESVLYRIAGAVDGTTLTYDPAPPPGAPTTLSAAQVAEFEASGAFSVASQDDAHPFLFTQYMSGSDATTRADCSPDIAASGAPCGLGDDDWVDLVPPAQFLQRYVFFTDPTYGTTNLVVVRKRGPGGFAEVTLSCLGVVTGFQPVGARGDYEVAHVDLVRRKVEVASCATSRHEAKSAQPFGVMVWGTDLYASYGYAAGGNIGSVSPIEVVPTPR